MSRKQSNHWRWLVQNWKTAWGANALVGHFLMFSIGFGAVMVEWLYGGAEYTTDMITMLGVFAAFVIFPPLLLPARGMDVRAEGKFLFILTFATSSMFGAIAGVLVAAQVKWAIAYIALLTAWAVCVSYWMTGQMSRNFQDGITTAFGSVPPHTQRLIAMLKTLGLHVLADDLQKDLLCYQHERARLATLGEISREIRMTDNVPAEQLNWLIERVQEEINDWPQQVGSPVDLVGVTLPGGQRVQAQVQISPDSDGPPVVQTQFQTSPDMAPPLE